MTAADPPGWVVRVNQRADRRRSRCRVCGHKRVVDTGQGPHCAVHAAQLPPPLPRRDDRSSCGYAWCRAHHHDHEDPDDAA